MMRTARALMETTTKAVMACFFWLAATTARRVCVFWRAPIPRVAAGEDRDISTTLGAGSH